MPTDKMQTANISHLFYKQYFKDINFEYLLRKDDEGEKTLFNVKNKKILDSALFVIPQIENAKIDNITATIQYPGLITGVGIAHEASLQGEFKLGMHFDYTYGMPVIYGSSVKGVLRSAFTEKRKYVESLLAELNIQVDVAELKAAIFDGVCNKKSLSIYDRDIFFDAVITKANSKGRILDSDAITPHGDNPLKNPNPITFMKIASGTTIEFRFDLKDSLLGNNGVTAKQKLSLFKTIIEDLGVGAKTNVGYGQFSKVNL